MALAAYIATTTALIDISHIRLATWKDMGLHTVDAVCFFLAVWLVRLIAKRSMRRGRLPPGPKPRLVIGNLLDMPSYKPWKTFTEWKVRWGELLYYVRLNR